MRLLLKKLNRKRLQNGTNIAGGFLTMRALVVKAVGVGFSVAGGLCVGKEGPLVHSGSCVAANLSHGSESCSSKDWKRMQNDLAKRDYVSGGCAAGVAAAFGAPIGGVLFSLEEASSFMSLPLLWRMFLAAMCSTFTLNFLLTAWKNSSEGINDPGLVTFGAIEGSPCECRTIPCLLNSTSDRSCCVQTQSGNSRSSSCSLSSADCSAPSSTL